MAWKSLECLEGQDQLESSGLPPFVGYREVELLLRVTLALHMRGNVEYQDADICHRNPWDGTLLMCWFI